MRGEWRLCSYLYLADQQEGKELYQVLHEDVHVNTALRLSDACWHAVTYVFIWWRCATDGRSTARGTGKHAYSGTPTCWGAFRTRVGVTWGARRLGHETRAFDWTGKHNSFASGQAKAVRRAKRAL